jgi:hypothetical protein
VSFLLIQLTNILNVIYRHYGTHHGYVLVVHTSRVAENEIYKLDLPAKRGSILSILCLLLVLLEILVAAPESFLCVNNVAVCP